MRLWNWPLHIYPPAEDQQDFTDVPGLWLLSDDRNLTQNVYASCLLPITYPSKIPCSLLLYSLAWCPHCQHQSGQNQTKYINVSYKPKTLIEIFGKDWNRESYFVTSNETVGVLVHLYWATSYIHFLLAFNSCAKKGASSYIGKQVYFKNMSGKLWNSQILMSILKHNLRNCQLTYTDDILTCSFPFWFT